MLSGITVYRHTHAWPVCGSSTHNQYILIRAKQPLYARKHRPSRRQRETEKQVYRHTYTFGHRRDDAALHLSGTNSTEHTSVRGFCRSTNLTVKGSSCASFSSEMPLSNPTAARATQAAVTSGRWLLVCGAMSCDVMRCHARRTEEQV